MTDEDLAATIRDAEYGLSENRITVCIEATANREDDFEAIREAVKEVLNE